MRGGGKREKGGRVILSFLHSPTAAPFPLWLPPGHPPRGVVKRKTTLLSVRWVLLKMFFSKAFCSLDTGVGVVKVLVRGKETVGLLELEAQDDFWRLFCPGSWISPSRDGVKRNTDRKKGEP